ncbi:MAG: CPBP family intramembrane metalloprotease [bacterium]|nr:CPBP family intramembrane metalloprotease [bacterium]
MSANPSGEQTGAWGAAAVGANRGCEETHIVWRLAAFAGLVVVAIVVALIVSGVLRREVPALDHKLVVHIVAAAGVVVAAGFCARRFEKRGLAAVGIGFDRPWVRHLAGGLMLGAGLSALLWGALCVAGGATVQANANPSGGLGALAVGLLYCMALAAFEELVCRGYAFQTLARGNLGVAVVLSGGLFVSMHYPKPDALAPLMMLNFFLCHLLFVVCYLRVRSLWLPIGVHAAWNFSVAFVFGLTPEGDAPGASLMRTEWPSGIWTGNAYGVEGGLVTTLLLALAACAVWFFIRQQRPESDLLSPLAPQADNGSVETCKRGCQ